MKTKTMVGLLMSLTAFAAVPASAKSSDAQVQRWQGILIRDGLDVPIEVMFAKGGADWSGELRQGSSSMQLEHVRVSAVGVHFELPGEGTFDGTVSGNSMAGSVSGTATPGGFALRRQPEPMFSDPITSSGP